MKIIVLASAGLLVTLAVGVGSAVLTQRQQPDPEETAVDRLEKSSTNVKLLFAQPFFLDEGYAHAWRADHPVVSSGYVIAVAADEEMLRVRQIHNPLLFVGDMPVERLNVGDESGVYVGLVPSPSSASGELSVDLTRTPIYWAAPQVLPESLTPEVAAAELAKARTEGVSAQRAGYVSVALAASGGAVYLPGYFELQRYAADVIERYSPTERDLVAGLRVPLVQ